KSRDVNVYLVGHDLHKNLHGDSGVDLSLKILKAIFDSIDAVKFFISPNFRIQFFNNPAFEKCLKLHGKRMKIGDNILEYVRDTENKIDQDFLIDFDKAVKGETVVSEKEIKYKHDKSKCFRTKYYPVYEEGNLIGVSVTVSDVTERTRYEDNIRLQNEKLRKIAFIQSHQVRQPLSNILGILSLVNTDGMSEDDKYLMKILNLSAQQLDQVVRKIVIEAQQLELYSEFFELHTPMQNS
ncbi:MAG: PAS domain-containing protein, partial [Chitinophagaceae bacterium]|nr:PAS domain-containing protein [Chitinophagaceae bacterium]